MTTVQNYLDCGCAIMTDGSRSWCPTCSTFDNGRPMKTEIDQLRERLKLADALAEAVRSSPDDARTPAMWAAIEAYDRDRPVT